MKTIKELRNAIDNKTLNDFQLQDMVKILAENIKTMSLGEELAFKEYIRKGANFLKISIEDLQSVYNSFKTKDQ